jgi:hypothetical protein
VGTLPLAVALADFNGDTFIDIAVLNSGASTVSVLLNQGNDGGFEPAPSSPYAVGKGATSIGVGHFQSKTSEDIAVTDLGLTGTTPEVRILFNLLSSSDGFQAQGGFAVGNGPSSVAVADYDADGFDDLAVANLSDGTVTTLANSGTGTFSTQSTLVLGAGNPQPNAVIAADFNGDGKIDLAVASNVSNDVRVFLNLGGSWSAMQGPFTVGTNPTSLIAGNFSGNPVSGLSDLAVANKTTGTVGVLVNQTAAAAVTATFWPQATYALSAGLVSIGTGKFNDAISDLAVANSTQDTVSILLGQCP